MPTTILIADDEYFIRQRLKKIILWENWNLHLVGEAENGEEVLALLSMQPVDIILLDIKMPKMSGEQVSAYVQKHYPLTKIIVLSGYNDFSYAQNALKNGVFDYLLKPIDSACLERSIRDCTLSLEKTKSTLLQVQQYRHYEKCTSLTQVLNKQMTLLELYGNFPEFCQELYSAFIGVYIAEDVYEGISDLVDRLRHIGINCEYVQESDHTFVIQLFLKEKEDVAHLGSLLTGFLASIETFVFLSMNHLFPIAEDWLSYYKRVLHNLNQRFFSLHSDLCIEYSSKEPKSSDIDLLKIRQTLTHYLNARDKESFSNYLQELFQEIAKRHDIEFLYLIIMEIFITYHIYYQVPNSSDSSITEFVTALIEEDYVLKNLQEITLHYGLQCLNQNQLIPSDVNLSKKVMDYIHLHYQEANLSVATLAEHFQLNASYLGTIFKSVNNVSILQYITRVRMDAAVALLEKDQYRISEIAEMIGFSDVFYFSKRFKKSFGYSPKDYTLRG